jgi:DNA-binding MarR family transcriptional regulator
MSVPTETQAPSLPLPQALLASHAFVMLQILRYGRRHAETTPGGPRLVSTAVLACLDEFGPQSQRDLCRRLGFDPSDMVAIIDALEADGHARRERDPADRRRHAIVMTPAGRAWYDEVVAGLPERMAALLPGLSPGELDTLLELLVRALAHLDERVPDHFRTGGSVSGGGGNTETP